LALSVGFTTGKGFLGQAAPLLGVASNLPGIELGLGLCQTWLRAVAQVMW